ncbi:MAG: GNAT family N-acetyltransferase [Acidimicrobiia bacterium]|nr:MAG: GNAT family N-acetyltransferase [Acidimicrobiia bacterium]
MHLADLPKIDDVTWRMFRDGDYVALTDLLNEDFEAGGHDTFQTVDDVRTSYQREDRLDEGRDILIAEADGDVIGHVSVFTWKELAGSRILFHAGRVTPAWKDHGIGTGMLAWVQGRLAGMAGAQDTITRTVGVSPATTEFMTKNGYVVTQHEAILVRPNLDDIPEVPLPDGIEVRPVSEADLRMVYEAEVEHFRDHWGSSEEDSGAWESFRNDPHRDMSMWQIAFADDQVIGIVRPFIHEEENARLGRKRGYTEDISTKRDWRGKGVATALITRALLAQRERGMTETALSVHLENPHGAYRLYQSLGFELHSRMDTLDLQKA